MIRFGAVAASVACTFVAACSGTIGQSFPDAGSGQWTGWVSFSGEFLLFDSREAMLRRDINHCLSGALPLNEQISASA